MVDHSDLQWSVWRYSTLKGQVWRSVCETEEELYARYVFRHYVEQTKLGYVQLRYGLEVKDEAYFPRPHRKKKSTETSEESITEESIIVENDLYLAKEIQNLAAINPILREIYNDFKEGKMNYNAMLLLAVQKLADFDVVARKLEDHIWESSQDTGSFLPSISKSTSKRVAQREFMQLLDKSVEHIKHALNCLPLMELERAAFYTRLLQNVRENIEILKAGIELDLNLQLRNKGAALNEKVGNSKRV